MGLIRGALFYVSVVILFLSIVLGGLVLVMSLSLEYENVESEFILASKNYSEGELDFIEKDYNLTHEINVAWELMNFSCENETYYNFSSAGYEFEFPCDLLEELEGKDKLHNYIISEIFKDNYYDEHEFKFFDFFRKTKLTPFLFSKQAKDYWGARFYTLLFLFFISLFLVFLFVDTKINALFIAGGIMIFSSVILSKVGEFVQFLLRRSVSFENLLFIEAGFVSGRLFIFGIIFIVAWLILRFLFSDFLKKKFSQRDISNIVKEELKKENDKRERKSSGKASKKSLK